ncbi:DUF779 domain-containing protein [Desulfotruncus alcoholivorax]|uniref:DUF779 domain-containing protein n=1 Tax=Desulfotruncus alcoholivorax TaxID=265477 RepID=UPI0004230D05|nr:DUF779 domain-containing protein [Desulfotruncus alcoholivorax]
MQVLAHDSVAALLEKVRRDRKGNLLIYIGEGCCDGTAPYLYENFIVEPTAVQAGVAHGVPVYTSQRLAALHAGETWLLSVISSVSDSFSIASDYGLQLVLSPQQPEQEG